MIKRTVSLLFLTILAGCIVPKAELPTPTGISPSQTPFPPTSLMSEDWLTSDQSTAQANFSMGDGGLISGEPCEAPCFFGIRIGETSLKQVVSTLQDHGLSSCEHFNERIIICGSQVIVGVDESTSLVNGIEYDPDISISVGTIIEKYGNPNSIIVELDNTGSPDDPKLIVFLLWDALKMLVELPQIPEGTEQTYIVKSTTEIRSVDYADEISYLKPPTSGSPQSWKGYGAYKP